MRRILLCLVLVSVTASTFGAPPSTQVTREFPTVNLPVSLRQQNWAKKVDGHDEGSCVHATMISLFRWQGRDDLADLWRKTYGGGEHPSGLQAKFDAKGVRYAFVDDGDVSFLEWACKTRRGCGVTVMGAEHMVALVHLDDKVAGILDNNDVEHILWVPREQFIAEWKMSYGWAVTPVYSPAPPLPTE